MLAEVASAELESDAVLGKDSAPKARKSVQQADALVLDQIPHPLGPSAPGEFLRVYEQRDAAHLQLSLLPHAQRVC
ncbi:hypothetical protein MRX96_024453 [Rhipicephalus microplus]